MPKEDNALPKFVQVLSAFGTLVPTAGTALPNLARVLPDFGTLVPKKGTALPKFAQVVPGTGTRVNSIVIVLRSRGSVQRATRPKNLLCFL
jgi:hypothetical protein